MTLNDTGNFMPTKTKRNGKAGRGFAPRSFSRLRRAEKAIEGMIALALTPRPITDAEIETFLTEHDADKHPLTKADRAALKKSRPELFHKIKDIIRGKPANESSSATAGKGGLSATTQMPE